MTAHLAIPDWLGAILPGLKGVPARTPSVAELARPLFSATVTTPANPIPSDAARPVFADVSGNFRRTLPDLIPSVTMSGGLLHVPQMTSGGAPAPPYASTSGQDKDEAVLTFGGENAKAYTAATHVHASDELLDDVAGLESFLRVWLAYLVALGEEKLILTSTGAGGSMRGFFTPGLCTAYAAPAVPPTTVEGVLGAAIAQAVSASNVMPDTAVIAPGDWATLALSGSRAFDPGVSEFAGLSLIVSPALAAGQFVVGPAQSLAVIGREGGVIVEGTRSNWLDFITNIATIRAESRLAFGLLMPKAFVVKSA